MKNIGVFTIIFIVFIVANVFLINGYVKAQEINIEVLIDGLDDVPNVGRIGESIKFENTLKCGITVEGIEL